MVGGCERVVVPDPDCRRHGIPSGIASIPHLRRQARSGEDDRSAEARLYAEAGTRRRVLVVQPSTYEGSTMTHEVTEDRSGREHEVAEVYVPSVHGVPAEGFHHTGGAPVLDQAEGTTASSETAAARRETLGQVTDGSLGLADLFQMAEGESGDSGRIIGHMHIRAALLALPGIGDKKADAILADVGVEGDRHIATLGSNQRDALVAAVAAQ
jgi:hypothetical protein